MPRVRSGICPPGERRASPVVREGRRTPLAGGPLAQLDPARLAPGRSHSAAPLGPARLAPGLGGDITRIAQTDRVDAVAARRIAADARGTRADGKDQSLGGHKMRGRHLFVRTRGRLIGLLGAAAALLALAVGVAPAQAHKAGSPRARKAGETLSGYGGSTITTIASGLNQPKKLSIAPDGSILVAESGSGEPSSECVTEGEEKICLNNSASIGRITPWGHVSNALSGLPSYTSGEGEAVGPAQARFLNGQLEVLYQDTAIDPKTGESPFVAAGALFGTLTRFPVFTKGSPLIQAKFGPFEAQNNPDKGEGTAVEAGQESPIDSDPYGFVPYHGGYVVTDAAGNDLLCVSSSGHISVLAVFPTIKELAPPGTFGPTQTEPVPVQAQPVPDSVAVGPDGALYVGELGGFPFNTGTSSVYRVVPGHSPQLVASGFTAIADIAFDPNGRLLVLEIDQAGLLDPAAETGLPTPGALIGVHKNGSKQLLASTGLEFPTGLAVSQHGSVFASNFGVLPASGGPGGFSGEVVKIGLPGSWWAHSW
jgi:hypothetical protein